MLCIGPLLVYTLLAGSNTPALRSFIMSLIFILAFCVNRPRSHLTILAAAALVIAAFDPQSIKSPSYQLSFSAVASIILLMPHMLSFMPSMSRNDQRNCILRHITQKTLVLVAITVSATAGTLPLLIYHFHQFSTVTLPANLLVEPLVCLWALPCGFLSIPFLFIHPPLAEAILTAGAWSLDIVSAYIGFLSTAPLSVLWLPDPNIFLIVMYYFALILAVSTTSKRFRSISYTAVTLTLGLFFVPLSGLNGTFQSSNSVSFIDVGQGSSSLLQLAGGRTIVIDAGATAAPGFNCGEKIVAPYLWSRGVGRIDDVILTHADADHYNGIPALFERFRPMRLWLPEQQTDKTGYQRLISDARQRDIEIKYPRNGVFIAHGHSTLSIIGDDMPDHAEKEKQQTFMESGNNDKGLVVSLQTPEFSILFPGDISSAKEQILIRTDRGLRHDILLSPHHGSSTSNSQGFLKTVKPDYMVVSAGSGRSGLFPAAATQESAEMLGISVLSTGYNGTVTVVSSKGGFKIETSAERD
jgi:competence protein ComEC